MIRIAIADDHALIRAGLKEILAARPNIQVIEATNGQELINKINSLRSEEHTSELQSRRNLVCRLLLEKKKHK